MIKCLHIFIGLAFWSRFYIMLGNDIAQDGKILRLRRELGLKLVVVAGKVGIR